MMQLWGGRFKKEEDEKMRAFDNCLPEGKRFYREDILGSLAHVKMLGSCGIIAKEEADKIEEGLNGIMSDVENGSLEIIDDGSYEDIHSFVELNLTKRIGELGKKLHTARSRNDQVAVDMKLFAKREAQEVMDCIDELESRLKDKADANPVIMPGYTHLQRAQVVTLKHYLMAYYEMLKRDRKRVANAVEILNECPLGCGALAGTTHNINREMTARELGFAKPVENYLDGVSDRDYLIELISAFALVMMHLSRLSEELILWSSQEFRFITLDDAYSTGSSMMPQKKNPDSAELIRGKTGRVYGSLMSLLTTMKGIPLAYDKDMQEDKHPFFTALDNTKMCLQIMAGVIATMKVNSNNMKKAVQNGFLNATELADYLVKKQVPFRDAHGVVGAVVLYCEENGCRIEDIPFEKMKEFSADIGEDVYRYIDYDNILNQGIKTKMK